MSSAALDKVLRVFSDVVGATQRGLAVRRLRATASQSQHALEATDVERWLRQLDQTQAGGQTRRAQRGRIDLMFDVLNAIANHQVEDPAQIASTLVNALNRDALLGTRRKGGEMDQSLSPPADFGESGRGAETIDSGPHALVRLGPDRMIQRHARRSALTLPQHRLIYFSTPKVASSTLKATLWRLASGDVQCIPPDSIHHLRHGSPLVPPPDLELNGLIQWINRSDHRRFCFVRNPYSRMLSCYLHKIRGNSSRASVSVFSLRASISGTTSNAQMSFAEFVETVSQQSPSEMDPHWRPQTMHLLWGRIPYDFVGRIEQFDSDLDRLGALLKIDLRPYLYVKAAHGTGSKELIEEFYTAELQQRVYDIYRGDFETFDYPRELKSRTL